MEWLSTETVLGALGVIATIGVVAFDRLRPGRRLIGYRVQMDTAIGAGARPGQTGARLGLFGDDRELTDATLVLLRIENDGVKDIGQAAFEAPLCAVFAGRRVLGVAVTDPSPSGLMERLTPENGLRYEDNRVRVPPLPLNTGDHFKLLVLLTGGSVGGKVRLEGTVHEGRIRPNRQHRGPRGLYLGLAAFLILIVGIAAGTRLDGAPIPLECAAGELTVHGSTAFAPVMEEIGEAYEADCEDAEITVSAGGSRQGIRALDGIGSESGDEVPAHLTLSDGAKPDGYPELTGYPVAVTLFTVVVHERVGLRDVSLADLRRVYAGEVRNWKEIGGADLPVHLVSRDDGSGTRSVFQKRVLKGFEHAADSSSNCRTQDDPRARVLRCELDSTREVLRTAADVPGAIGYAELQAAQDTEGVVLLRLDGVAAEIDSIAPGGPDDGGARRPYPYWEVEYAYTYGRPPADSPTSRFLDYLGGVTAQGVLRDHGHLSCAAPSNQPLCRRM